jgi:tripartite-type tricarboxylate transporter receptor subunit TctC
MNRRHFLISGTALAAAAVTPTLRAQNAAPEGTVSLVVGFPAGGGTDVLARLLGQKFSEMWGTPVVVARQG